MTDLSKRLRDAADAIESAIEGGPCVSFKAIRDTYREAADALDARDAEVGRLRRVLQMAVNDFDDLVGNSEGVSGLNLNGDIATWSDLSCGGMMEEWTSGLDAARAALNAPPEDV